MLKIPLESTPDYSQFTIVGLTFFGYVFGLAFSFVSAGLLHLWILIFGGKSDYSKTYQLSVYSLTPSIILRWIPFIGFFSSFYALYILIVGTPEIHREISMKKSILMYVIPVVVFFLSFLVLFGALFYIGLQSLELGLIGKAFGF